MTARKQLATQIVLLTSLLLLGAPVVADNANTTTMEVPVDLVPAVRELLAKRRVS